MDGSPSGDSAQEREASTCRTRTGCHGRTCTIREPGGGGGTLRYTRYTQVHTLIQPRKHARTRAHAHVVRGPPWLVLGPLGTPCGLTCAVAAVLILSDFRLIVCANHGLSGSRCSCGYHAMSALLCCCHAIRCHAVGFILSALMWHFIRARTPNIAAAAACLLALDVWVGGSLSLFLFPTFFLSLGVCVCT